MMFAPAAMWTLWHCSHLNVCAENPLCGCAHASAGPAAVSASRSRRDPSARLTTGRRHSGPSVPRRCRASPHRRPVIIPPLSATPVLSLTANKNAPLRRRDFRYLKPAATCCYQDMPTCYEESRRTMCASGSVIPYWWSQGGSNLIQRVSVRPDRFRAVPIAAGHDTCSAPGTCRGCPDRFRAIPRCCRATWLLRGYSRRPRPPPVDDISPTVAGSRRHASDGGSRVRSRATPIVGGVSDMTDKTAQTTCERCQRRDEDMERERMVDSNIDKAARSVYLVPGRAAAAIEFTYEELTRYRKGSCSTGPASTATRRTRATTPRCSRRRACRMTPGTCSSAR